MWLFFPQLHVVCAQWTDVSSLNYCYGYWSVVYLLNCCVVIELTKRKPPSYLIIIVCHLHHIYLFIIYYCYGYWSVVCLLNYCVVIKLTKRKTERWWTVQLHEKFIGLVIVCHGVNTIKLSQAKISTSEVIILGC